MRAGLWELSEPGEAPQLSPATHTGRPSSFALSTKKFPFFMWSCKEEISM